METQQAPHWEEEEEVYKEDKESKMVEETRLLGAWKASRWTLPSSDIPLPLFKPTELSAIFFIFESLAATH